MEKNGDNSRLRRADVLESGDSVVSSQSMKHCNSRIQQCSRSSTTSNSTLATRPRHRLRPQEEKSCRLTQRSATAPERHAIARGHQHLTNAPRTGPLPTVEAAQSHKTFYTTIGQRLGDAEEISASATSNGVMRGDARQAIYSSSAKPVNEVSDTFYSPLSDVMRANIEALLEGSARKVERMRALSHSKRVECLQDRLDRFRRESAVKNSGQEVSSDPQSRMNAIRKGQREQQRTKIPATVPDKVVATAQIKWSHCPDDGIALTSAANVSKERRNMTMAFAECGTKVGTAPDDLKHVQQAPRLHSHVPDKVVAPVPDKVVALTSAPDDAASEGDGTPSGGVVDGTDLTAVNCPYHTFKGPGEEYPVELAYDTVSTATTSEVTISAASGVASGDRASAASETVATVGAHDIPEKEAFTDVDIFMALSNPDRYLTTTTRTEAANIVKAMERMFGSPAEVLERLHRTARGRQETNELRPSSTGGADSTSDTGSSSEQLHTSAEAAVQRALDEQEAFTTAAQVQTSDEESAGTTDDNDTGDACEVSAQTESSAATDATEAAVKFTLKDISQSSDTQDVTSDGTMSESEVGDEECSVPGEAGSDGIIGKNAARDAPGDGATNKADSGYDNGTDDGARDDGASSDDGDASAASEMTDAEGSDDDVAGDGDMAAGVTLESAEHEQPTKSRVPDKVVALAQIKRSHSVNASNDDDVADDGGMEVGVSSDVGGDDVDGAASDTITPASAKREQQTKSRSPDKVVAPAQIKRSHSANMPSDDGGGDEDNDDGGDDEDGAASDTTSENWFQTEFMSGVRVTSPPRDDTFAIATTAATKQVPADAPASNVTAKNGDGDDADGDAGGGMATNAGGDTADPVADGGVAVSTANNMTDDADDENGDDRSDDDAAVVSETKDGDDDVTLWREYLQLAKLPAPPSRIPRQHVKEFIKAAERSAQTFLRTKTPRALFDILRLPKTVFDPYITRRRTAIVRSALKEYPRVELPDPDARDRKRRKRPVRPMTREAQKKAKVKRVEKLFTDGFVRKAMQALTSKHKSVPVTDEILQRLRELHPQQDINMKPRRYRTAPIKPDIDDMYKTVTKINVESSGGPSGWTPRHLRIAMRSTVFAEFLTMYAGMMAEGTAPGRLLMRTSMGIALKDMTRTDNKIRPIDMGEVIYKTCVIACYRKNREHGDLPWYMLGSGTPGGVEPLIYLKRQHLTGQGDWDGNGVVEIDRTNAYNTMSLDSIQESLYHYNPRNGPLFEWAYGSIAYTLVRTASGKLAVLPTTCVTQGDPPAPYWYQHGDRRNMVVLNEKLREQGIGMALSFLDDVNILKIKSHGASVPDKVVASAQIKRSHSADAPSEQTESRVPDKVVASAQMKWSHPANAPKELDKAADQGDPVMRTVLETLDEATINERKTKVIANADASADGYETLGGFIGPPRRRAAFVRTAADEMAEKIRALGPLRKQTQLILLRQCVIPALNHLMRNVDPAGCQQQYRRIQAMISKKISELAESPVELDRGECVRRGYRPRSGDRVRETNLVSLPTRYGGLGMGDQVVQATRAWEACQEQCAHLVQKWMKGTTSGRPPDPQKKRMEKYWLEASNQLMNKLHQSKCARIACNAEKSASAWLTTIPHTPDLLIPDAAIAAGLRCRLLQVRDRTRLTKRKILDQRLLDEFKIAGFDCKLVTTSTTYTSTDDPAGISDSIVEPMALSVENFAVSTVNSRDLPLPSADTPNILSYYRKKLHEKVTKIQRQRFRRHYPGYTHFPFTITSSGALMGKSEKWVKQLKQRSTLNQVPSPIIQLISATAVKSMW